MIIVNDPAPLQPTADGSILVAGTAVALEKVIKAFKCGASAGEIVARFPALNLADVYAVLAYYLRHQSSVESYLRRQQQPMPSISTTASSSNYVSV